VVVAELGPDMEPRNVYSTRCILEAWVGSCGEDLPNASPDLLDISDMGSRI
jgi:hypothetical protein